MKKNYQNPQVDTYKISMNNTICVSAEVTAPGMGSGDGEGGNPRFTRKALVTKK